jgi:hypothetical protein
MQAMDTSSWEPALSYLLPENPPLELLERARDHVLTYLDWVASDLASSGDADAIRKEINRRCYSFDPNLASLAIRFDRHH